MKFDLFTYIILAGLISSCGKDTEPQSGDYQDSILYQTIPFDEENILAAQKPSRWMFYGSADKAEGQKFCDFLGANESDFSTNDEMYLSSLTDEQFSIYKMVKNNQNLSEVYDSEKKIVCKKEPVALDSNI